MALMGGGMFSSLGGGKSITFNDKAGVDSLTLKDSDGFPIFRVDSQGNIKYKGRLERI